jgi:hypothetical protein
LVAAGREKAAACTRAATMNFTSRILEGLMALRGFVEPREGSWLLGAAMTAQFVTDALMMAIWRRGKFDVERKKK